jgi:hypothetical protein
MSGLIIQIGADVKGAIKGIDDVSLSLKEQKAVLAALQKQYASLSTEQARGKIGKEMAADIKIAREEISRLSAGATSGLGAVGVGATKAFSSLRQFAYVLPGIGVAGIVGGLADMAIGLVTGAEGFSKIELAAGHFKNEMKELNDELQSFKSNIDFSGKLEKLSLQLQGLTGPKLNAASSGVDITNNIQTIKFLGDQIEELSSKNQKLVASRQEFEKLLNTVGKSSELAKLVVQFGQITDLPASAVKKLSAADQELVQQYQATTDKIKELREEQRKAAQGVILSTNEVFKATKDGLKVDEITVKPKKIKIRDGGLIELPTAEETFKAFLKQEKRFRIPAILDFETAGDVTKLPKGIKEGIERIQDKIDAFFKRTQGAAKELGKEVGNSLFEAFNSSFSAIGEGIGNVLSGKGFGSGITDVFSAFLKQIGEALIKFGAIKEGLDKILGPGGIAIPGAFAIGLGVVAIAASKIFSNIGHRAAGGAVSRPVLVGERGPEIFVPSTSGRVIPNNNLSGLRGAASQMIVVTVEGIQRGRDVIYQKAKEERYQITNV